MELLLSPARRLGGMDLSLVLGVLAGLAITWIVLIALLFLLRPRDVRLTDLLRVVPDVLRLCRDLLADRGTLGRGWTSTCC
jgi:hypothetical protein